MCILKWFKKSKKPTTKKVKMGNRELSLSTETIVVNGHYDLELVVGEKYYITYGIHFGEYIYEGSDIDDYTLYFRNCETNEITFAFHSLLTSPFELTSIVTPIKK